MPSHAPGSGNGPRNAHKASRDEKEVVHRMLAYYDSVRDKAAKGDSPLEGDHALAHAHTLIPILPDQFIYGVDYARREVFMARGFERVLGYPDTEIDLAMTFSIIHPDDMDGVTTLVRRALGLLFGAKGPIVPMQDVWSMDYRMRKANGEYIKVLRQVCVLSVDEATGRVASTLSICKDISNIKTSDEIGWQYIGPDPDRQVDLGDIMADMPNVTYRPSARELDVLAKLAEGKSSRRIASDLGISEHTVSSHRKHLLARTRARNSAALIAMAVGRGWV